MGIANDTDALANASFARRRAFAGYTMVETPERRDFFYGNTLVLDREPDPAEHAAWVRRHAAHFAGTGVKRHAIVWERDGVSESPASPGPGVDCPEHGACPDPATPNDDDVLRRSDVGCVDR